MTDYLDIVTRFLPVLGTLAAVTAILAAANWFLSRRWKNDSDAQFRFQLIMLSLTFAGMLAIIVALPIRDAVRGQLLSLIGILLSAAIALSSTTFIGNIMAGIMLKVVKSARPGDFITVAQLTGRITEMGLLHTEIQTEFRDLVTVPNIYMVTQPLQVVRASGSIITAEVSLGYDTSHDRVAEILCGAAAAAGLKDGFVQVRELGDFSITYRVAGLLEDIQSLISARSALRIAMLDALHGEGIEIVSPNFMNTRTVGEEQKFVAAPSGKRSQLLQPSAEQVAFDKANDAAAAQKIRTAIEAIQAQLDLPPEEDGAPDAEKRTELEAEKERLTKELESAEESIRNKELAEVEGASDSV
jgi:small-conductance mechanosensitive channel